MNAEIVTIGTEILLGEIVDTNATHIARQFRTIGLNLFYKTTVGDNQARIADVLDRGLDRAAVIITTGGLGPTVDDVTREAVAQATGRPLEFAPALLEQIEARFNRWGSAMSENNRRQATIPQGALPIENPVGTAPCFIVETERGIIISLPGVPREMKYLLERNVLPYLKQKLDLRSIIKARILRTAGIGESRIDTALSNLLTAANPTVGLSAHPGQTDVRITAKAESEAEADQLIAPIEAEIRQRLGIFIYGTGQESVEEVLTRQLTEHGFMLSTAESGTGGILTHRLSAASRSVQVFCGGYVAPSPAALQKMLGLPVTAEPDSSETDIAAIEAIARQLATRLTVLHTQQDEKDSRVQSDQRQHLGLCVLILPRADTQEETSVGGTVIALVTPEEAERVEIHRLSYGGHSARSASWASTNAIEITRRWLLAHTGQES